MSSSQVMLLGKTFMMIIRPLFFPQRSSKEFPLQFPSTTVSAFKNHLSIQTFSLSKCYLPVIPVKPNSENVPAHILSATATFLPQDQLCFPFP